MVEGSFDYIWTLKKTLMDGSTKYSQVKGLRIEYMCNANYFKVVSGNIGSSDSNQWNKLEAEFEFADLSNLSELSIYLGGTPTDSSFFVDEVTPQHPSLSRSPLCPRMGGTGSW